MVFRSVPQLAFLCVEHDKCLDNLDRSHGVLHGIINIIYCVFIYRERNFTSFKRQLCPVARRLLVNDWLR